MLHPSRLFRGRLIRFATITITLLIILSVLWIFFLAKPYNRALATVTDKLNGKKITLVLGKDFDAWVSQESDRRAFAGFVGQLEENYICIPLIDANGDPLVVHIDGLGLDYGLLLLICFIVATPGMTWRQRLKFIPIALIIMFIIHIVAILIFAWVTISSTSASAAAKSPWVTLFLTVGCDLFPLLIWGALSYRYWLPPQTKGAKVRR